MQNSQAHPDGPTDPLAEIRCLSEAAILAQLRRSPAADLSAVRWPTEVEILDQLARMDEARAETPGDPPPAR